MEKDLPNRTHDCARETRKQEQVAGALESNTPVSQLLPFQCLSCSYPPLSESNKNRRARKLGVRQSMLDSRAQKITQEGQNDEDPEVTQLLSSYLGPHSTIGACPTPISTALILIQVVKKRRHSWLRFTYNGSEKTARYLQREQWEQNKADFRFRVHYSSIFSPFARCRSPLWLILRCMSPVLSI